MRWLTGISLGIGILVLLNQFRIPFYLYYPRTTDTVLISDSYDLYFFLITSACVPGTLAFYSTKLSKSGMIGITMIWLTGLLLTIGQQPYAIPTLYVTVIYAAVLNVSKTNLRKAAAAEILLCTLAIFVLIEYSTLYYWIGSAFNPQTQVGVLAEELELNLTFSLFPFAILTMLLLLFSWLWIPILTRYLKRAHKMVQNQAPIHEGLRNRRLFAASLDLFVILAILLFFYPYLAGQTWIVGVDSYINYLNPLNDLAGLTPSQAFVKSYSLHGLYVFLLYLIQLGSSASSFTVVKFVPLVLAFAVASAVFLATVRAGWKFELAILSSTCTLLWLPTTLGIFGGIQANWLAFVLWMLFLSFYFLSREWNIMIYILQALISFVIFVMHPWTWGVFFASLVFTAIITRSGEWKKRSLQGVCAALMIVLPAGIAAYNFLPSLAPDLGNTLGLYLYSLSQVNATSLLPIFGTALAGLFLDWGSFLSPLLLLISLVGAYALHSEEGIVRNYLLAWIAAWCLGSILVAPIGYNYASPLVGETELWRMLYISPLPILLALGIEKCFNFTKHLDALETQQTSRQLQIFFSAIFIVSGTGLIIFIDPLFRLVVVLSALGSLLFLVIRFQNKYPFVRTIVVSLLILMLINTAFRSLYPLLLDPHSLLGTFGAS
ncbi:MAG TPA: hypothetical protein VJZ03_03095 [Candidatus Bathyarchaeia archaeon]|nr:hypothetical protein [Candidatus Bathyarchaeia archaeon]